MCSLIQYHCSPYARWIDGYCVNVNSYISSMTMTMLRCSLHVHCTFNVILVLLWIAILGVWCDHDDDDDDDDTIE